jgi:hypothetical protein
MTYDSHGVNLIHVFFYVWWYDYLVNLQTDRRLLKKQP